GPQTPVQKGWGAARAANGQRPQRTTLQRSDHGDGMARVRAAGAAAVDEDRKTRKLTAWFDICRTNKRRQEWRRTTVNQTTPDREKKNKEREKNPDGSPLISTRIRWRVSAPSNCSNSPAARWGISGF
ncbi:hypothetical protein THAOC_04128, partial [Thalassiosira oceanica]